MPRRGEKFNSDRAIAYMRTYRHYKLGFVLAFDGSWCREGFLYQEPNPDYDKWLPENCTPIYFKDWLKDKIPPDMPKPKLGNKSNMSVIKPRPVVCVETGKFYLTQTEAHKDYPHMSSLRKVCCGDYNYGGYIFSNSMRWTYVDPFMPWDNLKFQGFIKKNQTVYPPNRTRPIMCIETGEIWNSVTDAAKDTGLCYKMILRKLKKGEPYFGLTFKDI